MSTVCPFTSNWKFPFKKLPSIGYSWRKGGCIFGAKRSEGKRTHAGCDILRPHNTPILAISDGKVIKVQQFFTGKTKGYRTDALVVEHDTYVIRYGEIEPGSALRPDGKPLKPGDTVKQGDVIAKVGFVGTTQMLHLEMYYGNGETPLSNEYNTGSNAYYPYVPLKFVKRNFKRRSDLMDPSDYLDQMAQRSGL